MKSMHDYKGEFRKARKRTERAALRWVGNRSKGALEDFLKASRELTKKQDALHCAVFDRWQKRNGGPIAGFRLASSFLNNPVPETETGRTKCS